MAKSRRNRQSNQTKQKRQSGLKETMKFELYGIVILSIALIALAKWGAVGRALTFIFRILMGTWDFVIPLLLMALGGYIMIKRQWINSWSHRMTGLTLLLLSLLAFLHLKLFNDLTLNGTYEGQSVIGLSWQLIWNEGSSDVPTNIGGGLIGAICFAFLHFLFEMSGTKLILIATTLIGILLITGLSYVNVGKKIKAVIQQGLSEVKQLIKDAVLLVFDRNDDKKNQPKKQGQQKENKEKQSDPGKAQPVFFEMDEPTPVQEPAPLVIHDFESKLFEEQPVASPHSEPAEAVVVEVGQEQIKNNNDDLAISDQELKFNKEAIDNYTLPPYSMLSRPKKSGRSEEHKDIAANAKKLESTLESFGVHAKVTQIHRGPAVTRYEVQPNTGVKVSRIVNLTDDLALALAAKDIRIEAPIPGKAAVGIEIPNSEVAVVSLREVLESSQFHEAESKLSVGLGRDISGEPIVGSLAKMPHVLVAGATGSGKSVCINGIIASVLYKAKPNEVKFLMIDPKMVELNVYNGIPHLLAPVVTDPKRASLALKKVVVEMEKRYEMFANTGTRNIEGYNMLMKDQHPDQVYPALPYIVVIVDELADLMMVAAADVEDSITRLAQMARAAGIHLIIATQRPSVDVITGIIKANIPSRIAFGVSSQIDSRTILDTGGAEKLLGRGDMLYLPVGASKPTRIQGAFVSDKEVEAIVTFVKEQQEAKYVPDLVPEVEESDDDMVVDDEYYDQAVKLVIEAKQASVSLLQRRLRIGYTRAARLIDVMEAKGVVGPYEGSKPREVLLNSDEARRLSG